MSLLKKGSSNRRNNLRRHAYLILAHRNPEMLKKLVEILDDERNDIYIHIDVKKKNEFKCFRPQTVHSHTEIFSCFSVNWGGFSIVKTEMLLLERAHERHYSYYHIISGEDYPIKSIDYIYDFFENCGGKEFILFKASKLEKESYERVYKVHILSEYYRRTKYEWLNRLFRGMDKSFVLLQNLIKYERLTQFDLFQRGAQWVSVTDDFVGDVINHKNQIFHDFKFSLIPDEMLFQTIALNFGYQDRLWNARKYNCFCQNMRLVCWKENWSGPFYFLNSDIEMIQKSDCLFARKISTDVDNELVEALERMVRKEEGYTENE